MAQNFPVAFYPFPYPNEINCKWNINAASTNERILLISTDLETEKNYEHVQVSISFNNMVNDNVSQWQVNYPLK